MTVYSNEASLKATFGDEEVVGLLRDAPGTEQPSRLDKAAEAAASEINTYLTTGGYVLPLLFTPYGEDVPAIGPPWLDFKLQEISDVFTAWHLSAAEDLSKKVYEARREAGLAWLDKLRTRELYLTYPMTAVISGAGQVTVLARCRVFNTMMKPENASFPRR